METRVLKKGDRVEIFDSPLSETNSLGLGTLVFKHGTNHGYHNGRSVEHWDVSFAGEQGTFLYTILV